MSCDFFFVDHILHVVAGLIDTQERETVKDSRMNLFTPIGNYADNNLDRGLGKRLDSIWKSDLFPGIWTPRLGIFTSA